MTENEKGPFGVFFHDTSNECDTEEVLKDFSKYGKVLYAKKIGPRMYVNYRLKADAERCLQGNCEGKYGEIRHGRFGPKEGNDTNGSKGSQGRFEKKGQYQSLKVNLDEQESRMCKTKMKQNFHSDNSADVENKNSRGFSAKETEKVKYGGDSMSDTPPCPWQVQPPILHQPVNKYRDDNMSDLDCPPPLVSPRSRNGHHDSDGPPPLVRAQPTNRRNDLDGPPPLVQVCPRNGRSQVFPRSSVHDYNSPSLLSAHNSLVPDDSNAMPPLLSTRTHPRVHPRLRPNGSGERNTHSNTLQNGYIPQSAPSRQNGHPRIPARVLHDVEDDDDDGPPPLVPARPYIIRNGSFSPRANDFHQQTLNTCSEDNSSVKSGVSQFENEGRGSHVVVANLPHDITKQEIEMVFYPLTLIEISQPQATDVQNLLYCHLIFASDDEASQAIEKFHGMCVRGQRLHLRSIHDLLQIRKLLS